MNKRKNEGITLIAMVISIIVLLILATVSISLIINNGILDKAKYAVDKYSDGEELEKIELAVLSAQMKNKGELTTENLNKQLQANFNNDKTVTESSLGWNYKASKNYRIYKDGKIEEWILPIEYKQVEYIESNGTQYIDTGLLAKTNTKIRIEISGNFTQSLSESYIFGAGYYKSETNSAFVLMGQTSKLGILMQDGWGTTEKKFSDFNKDKHIFIVDTISKCGILDNNSVELPGNKEDIEINYNYSLFALYQDGTFKGKCKFRMNYCKITDESNKFIRNFLPCYCTTTVTDVNGKQCPGGSVGLYDTAEDKFYTNQGTGKFVKGSDV